MLFYLYGLSFLFNFIYGVLLPVVPHLNEQVTGVAFTSFLLFKLLWFTPAGWLGDRIGHRVALALALAAQAGALGLIAAYPASPWLGRALEGAALAQGTLSTFAYLRLQAAEPARFRSAVAKLLGLGGLGMITGPTVGYLLLPFGTTRAILFLVSLSVVALAVGALLPASAPAQNAGEGELGTATRGALWFALGLTAAKSLGVGWEPNLAWWAQERLGLSSAVAGLSFVVLGVAFIAGSLRSSFRLSVLAVPGLLALEYSLRGSAAFWWPALAALGFWYGVAVSIAVSRLGWDKPESVGRHNSLWMLGTDLPMTFVPTILWAWHEPAYAGQRTALGFFFLVTSLLCLWRGLALDSRVPIGSR